MPVCETSKLIWDMWHTIAHTQAPLTELSSIKVKFECTDVEQKTFMDMKIRVDRDVIL